ncbi:hypothetical protein [Cohnella hashimotonis]|uniref:Uncharacterized protein n=1 Tax=Cohnella hashimotonis TaxID=2826895 RepID=A0ABT6THL5_9BACL|nr:hypothetical protein [Cohnella hashimotonis]MDI4646333.1 hypothetical protein [Cohnella hashimotonis]
MALYSVSLPRLAPKFRQVALYSVSWPRLAAKSRQVALCSVSFSTFSGEILGLSQKPF